jgi:hypothetical protein
MKQSIKQIFNYFFVVLILTVIKVSPVTAQNITSPYSILGIGDVDTKDFGRYFGSGNAAVARRNLFAYNFSNPASLTGLPFKTMHFDIATRGRYSNYFFPNTDTALGIPSTDFIIKRVTMAFKVSEKTGIAFGLKPYSSVNYSYLQDNVILDGNTSYFKLVDGDGGINQFYFSYARKITKQISAGATASTMFGSLQRKTQYFSPGIALNIVKDETDFYNGAMLQGGIQYYSLPGKKWKHQIGLVSAISTNLRGELTTVYTDEGGAIKKDIDNNRIFKLPISVSIGYSAVKADKLTLSVEGNYYYWKYQKVNYNGSYTSPSFRISGGIEYAFLKKQGNTAYEKGYISMGANIEKSYLRIKKNNLWDYSFSVGLGRNLSRNISWYSGIELGNKGNKSYNQVQEKYTQFIMGLTIKDIWLGPKFKKFD